MKLSNLKHALQAGLTVESRAKALLRVSGNEVRHKALCHDIDVLMTLLHEFIEENDLESDLEAARIE